MGLFIVFEGIEGSGKSTQSRELERRLVQSGYTVTLTREPGGTPTGDRVREELLYSNHQITPIAEVFLFSASRTLLVDSVIRPALLRNEVVVCDRYSASTLAYQGFARGIAMEAIERTNDMATMGLYPDLSILLDIDPVVGLSRKEDRKLDRIERERLGFHRRAREGFAELARRDPLRWLVLDGSDPKETIALAIWRWVSKALG